MTYTQTVIDTVCARRGVSARDVLSPTRNRPVAWARQEAQHILRVTTKRSLPEIGRSFDRDHTSVLHGLRAVQRRMRGDIYRNEIEEMTNEARKKSGAFFTSRPEPMPTFKSTRSQ